MGVTRPTIKRGSNINDSYIVTTYVVIDDTLKAYGLKDACQASGTAVEILTVSVVAAKYFQNNHDAKWKRWTSNIFTPVLIMGFDLKT